jgi:hypothetical protein
VLTGPLGQYLVTTAAGLAIFLVLVKRSESARGATELGLLPRFLELGPADAGAMTGSATPASGASLDEGTTAVPATPDPVPLIAGVLEDDESRSPEGEAGMPRWLRPSVRSARGIEPTRRQP